MGQVIVTFKVMPADGDVDMNNVENEIKQKISPQKISREPIAFGIVALLITKLIDEVEGTMETTENAIRAVKGVGEVEITEINRSM
jgi:translation elongation factor aEF-1 beta